MPQPDGPRQLPLDFDHAPSHAEDDFLVGDGNALAHGHIISWPNWPDAVAVLMGPAASGKSHLARIFADRSHAEFVTPETVGEAAAFPGRHPIVIEDADRLPYDESAVFHLLNQAVRAQRALLVTARTEVVHWPLATDDVRSRIRRAPQLRLEISDDIELSQMLVKLFGDRQIRVDPKVVAYLVTRMERSHEEAAILVDLLDRLALAKGSAITRNIAAEGLSLRRAATEPHGQQDWDPEIDE